MSFSVNASFDPSQRDSFQKILKNIEFSHHNNADLPVILQNISADITKLSFLDLLQFDQNDMKQLGYSLAEFASPTLLTELLSLFHLYTFNPPVTAQMRSIQHAARTGLYILKLKVIHATQSSNFEESLPAIGQLGFSGYRRYISGVSGDILIPFQIDAAESISLNSNHKSVYDKLKQINAIHKLLELFMDYFNLAVIHSAEAVVQSLEKINRAVLEIYQRNDDHLNYELRSAFEKVDLASLAKESLDLDRKEILFSLIGCQKLLLPELK